MEEKEIIKKEDKQRHLESNKINRTRRFTTKSLKEN